MDEACELMDKTCRWIKKVIGWVEHADVPPVLYVGTGQSFANAPAPFIEVVYVTSGICSDLRIGPLLVTIPEGHMSLHSVHPGNYSGSNATFMGHCLFLDASRHVSFRSMKQNPFFVSTPVRRGRRMIDLFDKLNTISRESSWVSRSYPPDPIFLSSRDADTMPTHIRIMFKACLLEILGVMLEEASGKTSLPLPEAINAALGYIERNYADPSITRAVLAATAGLSPDHFGRLFRQCTRTNPMEYLRRTRITNSCFLLRNTSLRIGEISREVGFRDEFYFSRVFKQIMKTSPTLYRNGADSNVEDLT